MIALRRFVRDVVTLVVAVLISSCASYDGQVLAADDISVKHYTADVSVYSLIPNVGIDSFRGNSGGGVSPGGTVGVGISRHQQLFEVSLAARLDAKRFLAKLSVTSPTDDKVAEREDVNRELDLTDLEPHTLELARDEDGRVYRVKIVPRVDENERTKVFRVKDLELEQFSFSHSTVIVDDQDYLGTMDASAGSLGWVEIPGLALIEFSLLPLKDSQPEGVLNEGTLNIMHGSTSLKIDQIRNGRFLETLKGGPYRVFVRWKPPSMTIEEYRQELRSQIQFFKTQSVQLGNGNSEDVLLRLKKMTTSDRVHMMSHGLRAVERAELNEPQRD